MLRFDDLVLDLTKTLVRRGETPIMFGDKEIKLLELFLRHPDEILSPSYISESLWQLTHGSVTTVVDTNVRRLTIKIDDPFKRPPIQTIGELGHVLR